MYKYSTYVYSEMSDEEKQRYIAEIEARQSILEDADDVPDNPIKERKSGGINDEERDRMEKENYSNYLKEVDRRVKQILRR